MARDIRFLRWQFSLREALFLGFCATFVILTRAALRLHFGLPGHSMFFLAFFLLLARGCVPRVGAAALVGVVSGLVCLLLGMTKSGPLVAVNFGVPALIVEVGAALVPRLATSTLACAAVGTLASASKGVSTAGMDYLLRMDPQIVPQHVAITTVASAAFGAAGSLLVPPVVRRLQANGLVAAPRARSPGLAATGVARGHPSAPRDPAS